jgi:hypothetical protein
MCNPRQQLQGWATHGNEVVENKNDVCAANKSIGRHQAIANVVEGRKRKLIIRLVDLRICGCVDNKLGEKSVCKPACLTTCKIAVAHHGFPRILVDGRQPHMYMFISLEIGQFRKAPSPRQAFRIARYTGVFICGYLRQMCGLGGAFAAHVSFVRNCSLTCFLCIV